jgi:hypothetical protein
MRPSQRLRLLAANESAVCIAHAVNRLKHRQRKSGTVADEYEIDHRFTFL